MKYLFLALVFTILFSSKLYAQNTYVPDDKFEQALIDLGLDNGELNDSVVTDSIEGLEILRIVNRGISDLRGIEDFVSLRELYCSSNQVKVIDLRKNLFLEVLHCYWNKIVDLDLSMAVNLKDLNCGYNNLSSINIRNGNNLNLKLNTTNNENLFCIEVDDDEFAYDQLGGFNWQKDNHTGFAEDCSEFATRLTYIPDDDFEKYLISNKLDKGSLDNYVRTISIRGVNTLNLGYNNIKDLTGIEDFEFLENFHCYYNQLADLDLSSNLRLVNLQCQGNQLIDLDLSQNINLTYINCADNQLSSLNIKNGNNSYLRLNVIDNPNLLCIQVDDTDIANSKEYWEKHPWTDYSIDCSGFIPRQTYVPDDNFEQVLIDKGLDFGQLNDSIYTVAIEQLKELRIWGGGIEDLAGIEDFISLESLMIKQNKIVELDLLQQPNLKHLNCENNELNSLTLESNKLLETLNCSGNNIENLDLSKNKSLVNVDCGFNRLTSLDLRNGNNHNMTVRIIGTGSLYCVSVDDPSSIDLYENWATSYMIDFSKDCVGYVPEMTYVPDNFFEDRLLSLGYDNIQRDDSIPTVAARKIKELRLYRVEDLTGIQDFTSLEKLDCGMCELTEADLRSNINLKFVSLHMNDLVDFKIGENEKIETLNVSLNNLNEIDVSSCPNLKTLSCGWNNLLELDLKSNLKLEELVCSNNKLTNLNISANQMLRVLLCSENQLVELDLKQNELLEGISCSFNLLNRINLEKNTELEDLRCDNNLIRTLNLKANVKLRTNYCNNNRIQDLDLSFNNSLLYLNCSNNDLKRLNLCNLDLDGRYDFKLGNNPELFCIEIDDVNIPYNNTSFLEDSWAVYSEDCNYSCIYNFLEEKREISSTSILDSIFVSTEANCKWSANIDCDWINIISKDSILGDGYLVYIVDENNSTLERTGKISINKEVFTIVQEGIICEYDLSETFQRFSSIYVLDSIYVNTSGLCEWNADVDCDWVRIISETSGVGNDTIIFSVDENDTSLPRTCKMIIEQEEFVIEQEGITCDYELSGTQQTIDSDGGKSSVDITCEEECYWELAVNCDWVTITSEKSGNGNGVITFSVDENTDENERFCEMIIAGINYSVIQKGQQSTVPQIYPNDYNNLVNIFNSLGSEEWQNNTNWLDTINYSVSEWHGVTIENGYVTALDLSELNLVGNITHLFSEFDSLKWLNISNNNLTGSFSGGNLKKSGVFESVRNGSLILEYLNIANNKFTFADLEPAVNDFSKIKEFFYSPQSDIQERYDTAVYKNQSLTLQPKNYIKGVHDSFIWKKDNEIVDGQNELYFKVQEVAYSDSGNYQLVISNELFPELELHFQNHVSVLIPVGINEQSFSNYNIYPNPASDKIYIDTAGDIIDLKVFDQYGRIVLIENEIESGWFDINKLVDGSYVFKLISKDLLAVNKIVVIR